MIRPQAFSRMLHITSVHITRRTYAMCSMHCASPWPPPRAATHRAAANAVAKAEETRKRVQEPLHTTIVQPERHVSGRPAQMAQGLEQIEQAVKAARQESTNASPGSESRSPRAFASSATRTTLSMWSKGGAETASSW